MSRGAMDMCDRLQPSTVRTGPLGGCGYGSRPTLTQTTSHALQVRQGRAYAETFSPAPTPRWSGLPSDMVGCRGTVHHRTCNADGSEQRDMGH
jgi:hypothetical protein